MLAGSAMAGEIGWRSCWVGEDLVVIQVLYSNYLLIVYLSSLLCAISKVNPPSCRMP